MSSILTNLNDDDLNTVLHMIRKDAMSDTEISAYVEAHLPVKWKKKFAEASPAAKVMVITRYRGSSQYKRWLKNWENRDLDLRKSIELQKQRFELLSNLVKDPANDGLETISKSIQARVLTLAAEMDDEELLFQSGAKGPVAEILKLVRADLRDTYRKKVEQLKSELAEMLAGRSGTGKLIATEKVIDRVDEIMGLKK